MPLALTLLVAGIAGTDHSHNTVATDNFAVATYLFNWSSYFHFPLL